MKIPSLPDYLGRYHLTFLSFQIWQEKQVPLLHQLTTLARRTHVYRNFGLIPPSYYLIRAERY